MIAYAEAHGIPVTASATKSYSMDRNLLHISYESGVLEDPWFDASAEDSKDMYLLSVSLRMRRMRRNTSSLRSSKGMLLR